ncbi:MAG: YebC/PmpR family DNA-binding transcriptional regulator, partial [Acidobacteriota bacterium]|nr:YebC/PmpR family DNA-binding transcriptional regulator [Acidobacteriota bacterium]
VAVLVNTTTDNRNRTVAEIRHVFSKNGGNMGESNSVSWMFNRKGQIVVDAALKSEDEMMEIALEAGADDVTSDADTHQIFTAPEDFHSVLEAIKSQGIEPMSAELAMIPQNTIKLEGADATKMLKLYEALDDHDDVQSVYANFEMDDSALE